MGCRTEESKKYPKCQWPLGPASIAGFFALIAFKKSITFILLPGQKHQNAYDA